MQSEHPGRCDSGKADSPFEAISFNRRTGKYLRTRHTTPEAGLKRLHGNTRHVQRKLVDHTPRLGPNGQPLPVQAIYIPDVR